MIQTYWQQLSERDQWSILIGGTCSLIYLLYILIFAPLSTHVTEKNMQLQEKQATLLWMQKAEKEFAKPSQAAKKIDNGTLLSLISAQCQTPDFKAFPYQMNQNASGSIQLSFEKIPYNTVIRWLQSFSQNYQIQIKSLRIQQTPTPGIVQFNLNVDAK